MLLEKRVKPIFCGVFFPENDIRVCCSMLMSKLRTRVADKTANIYKWNGFLIDLYDTMISIILNLVFLVAAIPSITLLLQV